MAAVAGAVGKWESRAVCGISKRGGKVGFWTFPPRVFSTARRAAILLLPRPHLATMLRMVSYSHRPKSGQITCYLNRTYHVLTTNLRAQLDTSKQRSAGLRLSNTD